MKANELRIGNIVIWGYNDELCTLLKIGKNECTFLADGKTESTYCDLDYLKPIPLTDEWLYWFGAEINHKTYVYDRFKLIWKKAYKYWYVVDKESLTYLTKVESVHEWQNFVYTMNSEELVGRKKIKEKAK